MKQIDIDKSGVIDIEWLDNQIQKYSRKFPIHGNEVVLITLQKIKSQITPLKPIAEKCYDEGFKQDDGLGIYDAKEEFLNSKIEL